MNDETWTTLIRFLQGGGLLIIAAVARYYLKPISREIKANRELSDTRHNDSMAAHGTLGNKIDDANESINLLSTKVTHIEGTLERGADRMDRIERDVDNNSKRVSKASASIHDQAAQIAALNERKK